MSDFDFGTDVEENVEQVAGAGWSADDSGVYIKGITQAYLSQSAKGAFAVNLATKSKEGDERNYTFYFTNRAGQTYYIKDKKKFQLPGYSLLNAICQLTCGKSAQEVLSNPKLKVIDLMDWESRKEVPTEVKTYPQICKKAIKFGITKKIDNKFKKGKPIAEKRESNEISMVFDAKTGLTITEVAKGDTEAKLLETWLARWEGNVDDQYVEVESEEEMEVEEGDNPFGESDTKAKSTDSDDDSDDDMFG